MIINDETIIIVAALVGNAMPTLGDLWEFEKIVETLEELPIKEKLAALEVCFMVRHYD